MEPRKKLRRYHEPGHLHELTFSCFRRLPLLDSDDRRSKLARCIDSAGEETNVRLLAFVFMPEHVHLLVQPDDLKPRLDLYLARIKQPFSEQMHAELSASAENLDLIERLTVQERPGKKTFRFWMPGGGYDRNLFTPEAIAACLDYLHNNPVKRGLCERAIDWKMVVRSLLLRSLRRSRPRPSSAHAFSGGQSSLTPGHWASQCPGLRKRPEALFFIRSTWQVDAGGRS